MAEVDVALHEEDGVVRPVEAAGESMGSFTGESLQAGWRTQYDMTQRVAGEDEDFKVDKYQFCVAVFVRLYFYYDDY